jgi:hypothetical protein
MGAPIAGWRSIACSADGCRMVAAYFDHSSYKGLIYTAQITLAPRLDITPSEASPVLAWTVPSTRLVLQQNADLATTNWTDVATVPTLNCANLKYQVAIQDPLGRSFYRLASR